jgi:hypothetical protein
MLDTGTGRHLYLLPVVDADGQVQDFTVAAASPSVVDLSGRSGAALVGRALSELYPWLVDGEIWHAWRQVVADGRTRQVGPLPYRAQLGQDHVVLTITARAEPIGPGLLTTWTRQDEENRLAERISQMERLGNLGWGEWDLINDTTVWSDGMYTVFERDPADAPCPAGQWKRGPCRLISPCYARPPPPPATATRSPPSATSPATASRRQPRWRNSATPWPPSPSRSPRSRPNSSPTSTTCSTTVDSRPRPPPRSSPTTTPATALLRWAQAGHPAVLQSRNGATSELPRPAGPLLGAIRNARYDTAQTDLTPGDVLLFYTDGLIEHRHRPLLDGLAPVVGTLNRITANPRPQPLADLLRELHQANPDDDTCLLAARPLRTTPPDP